MQPNRSCSTRQLRPRPRQRSIVESSAAPLGYLLPAQLREFTGNRCVVEGIGRITNDLAGFMPFPCNNQEIAGGKFGNSRCDRLTAVADLDRVRGRFEDRSPNLGGRLGSGIVVSHINAVGQARRHFSHQRTLACVAVATTAKESQESSV